VAIESIPEAVAISLAPTFAVIATGFINWRASKRAEKAALGAIRAQEHTATAQKQAADAARLLIVAARDSNAKLDQIVDVGAQTHKIVDGGRTVMMNLVATMAERIAKENPGDADALLAAKNARRDARAAEESTG
jgi:hypothetical protein